MKIINPQGQLVLVWLEIYNPQASGEVITAACGSVIQHRELMTMSGI